MAILEQELELCPDPFSRRHTFFNLADGKTVPARCKRWGCLFCAKKNYFRVSYLAAAGRPERFMTLTRAGTTPKDIRLNLSHFLQGCRRAGYRFEYFAVPELHANGEAHFHILQKGSYIPFDFIQEKWKTYTARSYQGAGSFFVNVQKIENTKHAVNYIAKYMKKSYAGHDGKSWAAMQSKFPGVNHYRHSRQWLPETPQSDSSWVLVPNHLLPTVQEEWAFGEAIRRTLVFRHTLIPVTP
jgi:hypothetical protein